MTDKIDAATRSKIMSSIKGTNTKPELIIRKGLFKRGYRYRLHPRGIPGKPDIVLPKYNVVVFVNGCFWHGHNCRLFIPPSSNKDYWREKIITNKRRDEDIIKKLLASGYRVLVIWECSITKKARKPLDLILDQVEEWLISGQKKGEIRD